MLIIITWLSHKWFSLSQNSTPYLIYVQPISSPVLSIILIHFHDVSPADHLSFTTAAPFSLLSESITQLRLCVCVCAPGNLQSNLTINTHFPKEHSLMRPIALRAQNYPRFQIHLSAWMELLLLGPAHEYLTHMTYRNGGPFMSNIHSGKRRCGHDCLQIQPVVVPSQRSTIVSSSSHG